MTNKMKRFIDMVREHCKVKQIGFTVFTRESGPELIHLFRFTKDDYVRTLCFKDYEIENIDDLNRPFSYVKRTILDFE